MLQQTRQYLSAFAGSPQEAIRQGGTSATYSSREPMKNTFSKKQLGLAVACALAFGFASGAARADGMSPNSDRQVWTENTRAQIWRNAYGECWHDNFGPPPGYNECNPAPLAQNAPAPYVAPVVVAAAPKPVSQKVTFDADVLFDFDKAVLRPEGKTALDGFAGQLPGISLETISVIGFADRFGTDEYNKVLSDKRAATVKSYLVAKGIEPNRMYSEGKGEAQPVTKPGECLGAKSAKVIACLQPDRRVDVELIGTRTTQ
jgi:OOP family OmpA-OmpF porin